MNRIRKTRMILKERLTNEEVGECHWDREMRGGGDWQVIQMFGVSRSVEEAKAYQGHQDKKDKINKRWKNFLVHPSSKPNKNKPSPKMSVQ